MRRETLQMSDISKYGSMAFASCILPQLDTLSLPRRLSVTYIRLNQCTRYFSLLGYRKLHVTISRKVHRAPFYLMIYHPCIPILPPKPADVLELVVDATGSRTVIDMLFYTHYLV